MHMFCALLKLNSSAPIVYHDLAVVWFAQQKTADDFRRTTNLQAVWIVSPKRRKLNARKSSAAPQTTRVVTFIDALGRGHDGWSSAARAGAGQAPQDAVW